MSSQQVHRCQYTCQSKHGTKSSLLPRAGSQSCLQSQRACALTQSLFLALSFPILQSAPGHNTHIHFYKLPVCAVHRRNSLVRTAALICQGMPAHEAKGRDGHDSVMLITGTHSERHLSPRSRVHVLLLSVTLGIKAHSGDRGFKVRTTLCIMEQLSR